MRELEEMNDILSSKTPFLDKESMLNIFLQNERNKQGVLNVVHLRPIFILSFVMLKNMLILLVKANFCLIFFSRNSSKTYWNLPACHQTTVVTNSISQDSTATPSWLPQRIPQLLLLISDRRSHPTSRCSLNRGLSFTYTANGKSQIQVDNFSK